MQTTKDKMEVSEKEDLDANDGDRKKEKASKSRMNSIA